MPGEDNRQSPDDPPARSSDRIHVPSTPLLHQSTERWFQRHRRVAFVCLSEATGGLELSTLRIAQDCRRRGAEPLIVAPAESPLAALASNAQMPFAAVRSQVKYGDVAAAVRLASVFRQKNIEVAVVMRSRDLHLAALARLWRRHPHLVYYQQMQSGVQKRDPLHTWIFSNIDLWLTLTQRMREEVLRHTRMRADRVWAVPLGRDTRLFHPKTYTRTAARRLLGLPTKPLTVGMLGRLDPQKGQEEFVRSIPAVLERYPRTLFVIAGDETKNEPGYRQYVERLIRDLGIDRSVRMLAGMENVRPFFSALDIFVMPSHSETYGLVLVEAMAMGKPAIATNAGGVPEIVTDGEEGLLIPPRNPDALANTILRLIGDRHLRRRLSRNARQRASQEFDSELCLDRFISSLETI